MQLLDPHDVADLRLLWARRLLQRARSLLERALVPSSRITAIIRGNSLLNDPLLDLSRSLHYLESEVSQPELLRLFVVRLTASLEADVLSKQMWKMKTAFSALAELEAGDLLVGRRVEYIEAGKLYVVEAEEVAFHYQLFKDLAPYFERSGLARAINTEIARIITEAQSISS